MLTTSLALSFTFHAGFLNLIYFWIADGYLKASAEHTSAHENDDSAFSEDKKESLIEDVAESELKIYNPPWSAIGGACTTAAAHSTASSESINNDNKATSDAVV